MVASYKETLTLGNFIHDECVDTVIDSGLKSGVEWCML